MAQVVALPSNVEAEKSVLGSMLVSPEAADVALGALEEDDFSDVELRNKMVFHAMEVLHSVGRPIDPQTVIDELTTLQLNGRVSNEYIFSLMNTVIDPANVDHYIKMVHEQSVLRAFLRKMQDIEDQYAKGVPDIDDFIEKCNNEISQIAQRRMVEGMSSASQVAKIVGDKIAKASTSDTRGLIGVDTGYKRLNEYTHGWQKGDLIYVAGRPGMGKTALGLNFAYNAALKSGVTVAFFSLEMSSDQLMERLVASRSSVDGQNIMTGYLNAQQKLKISSAIDEISEQKIYFSDTPNAKLGDIIAQSTKLKAQHPDLGLIVVDYLGRIRTTDNPSLDQRQNEVGFISGSLKQLARTLDVPVICLAQLNRNVEQNESKRPELSNLRESGSIEQDADLVLLLYRADYYTDVGISLNPRRNKKPGEQEAPEQEQPKVKDSNVSEVSVIVAKNRKGKTGEIKLIFMKNYSRFNDPSSEYEEKQAEAFRPNDE